MPPVTISPTDVGVPVVDASNATLDRVLNAVFLVIGAVAILVLVLAALSYITSSGDAGKAKRAKEAILYAVVGIVVSLSAFGIVQFVLGKI